MRGTNENMRFETFYYVVPGQTSEMCIEYTCKGFTELAPECSLVVTVVIVGVFYLCLWSSLWDLQRFRILASLTRAEITGHASPLPISMATIAFVRENSCNRTVNMVRKNAPHKWKFTYPFHSQEWSISNFPCSVTRDITSHSMKNLAFHSLLRRNMIMLSILTTSLIHSSLKGWENVLFCW